jgi:Uncharacterized protein with SCP/PR1 domains
MGKRRTPRLVAFVVTTLLTLSTLAIPARAMPIASAGRASALTPRPAPVSRDNRAKVLELINRSRASHHLGHLRLRVSLSDSAWRHSYRMMKAGRLFHTPNLAECILSSTNATRWGENIASGPSVGGINSAWMGSPVHRQNILDPRFRRAGIGVVKSGAHYWITLDLYG